MKDLYKWLLDLPKPYGEMAMSQIDEQWAMFPVPKMSSAILGFNAWDKTKEGVRFWGDVTMHYECLEMFPKWKFLRGVAKWYANKYAPLPEVK